MTCSFVRVFLKSRFTVPSSFLKRRDRAELDGEGGSWGRSRVSAAMHVAKQDVTSVSGSCRICLCSRGEQRQQVSACTSQVIPQPQCIDLYANRTPHHQTLAKVTGNADKLSSQTHKLSRCLLLTEAGPVSGVSEPKWLPMAAVAENDTDTSSWMGKTSQEQEQNCSVRNPP